MARDDDELERISTMLRQCLGRIDEEAFRLQDSDGDEGDFGTADRIEGATEELQGLVESLLAVEDPDEADVNKVVAERAAARLQKVSVPVIQRLRLADGDPVAAVSRATLANAVDRALAMAVTSIEPGGQLTLCTRGEDRAVVVELEVLGAGAQEGVSERAETLRDFVAGFGGTCAVRSERGDLFLVLEVPRVMASEPRDRG